MLDVRRLRVLREVVARGSFSGAADTLHLSQSAVSQQVAALEREVGMQLLDRTSEGPRLTPAGETLMGHADVVLARLDEAERELAEIAGLEGGLVRLVSFPTASATLVTHAVSTFRARFPDVDLKLGEAEPHDSLPALRAGEYDVALAYDFELEPEEPGRDLERQLILEETMEVALPKGHPLAASKAIALPDLAEDDWLCGVSQGSCRAHVIRICQNAGFDPRIGFESDDYTVLQGLVAGGLGVALLPELALSGRHPEIVVRPVTGKPPVRRVWAVTREGSGRSPATEAMLGILGEVGERFAAENRLRLAA
jgi:DNA-binding transcriptional LysR family regulator